MPVDTKELRLQFRAIFHEEPRLWSAPGRVNLIGEHTDYNDGFVLPMAIDRRTWIAGAARKDRLVRVFSLNFDETGEFDLDAPADHRSGYWLNYIEGTARVLESRGHRLRGANLAITSNVPPGAGLSSSAALEISSGLVMMNLAGKGADLKALALAGQEAEHRYVGAEVGIMDQFVSALAERGCALLIDCRDLEVKPIPLDSAGGVTVLVSDTNVKHDLASSEYNTRRAECRRGVELLRSALPGIGSLRDVSVSEFNENQELLPEPIKRRCRHVVTENARTLAAAEALRVNDFARLGMLMAESHKSLRDDYEVSSKELDLMVDLTTGCDGVFGSRMTGGGFGGCTVTIAESDAVPALERILAEEYTRSTGISPAFYRVQADAGAREELI